MCLKSSEMGIKIHPFRLPLLLINVCHPHERSTSCLERGEDLGNKQMRDDAGVERSGTEHDEVRLLNRDNR
jgi:hypothetical protein